MITPIKRRQISTSKNASQKEIETKNTGYSHKNDPIHRKIKIVSYENKNMAVNYNLSDHLNPLQDGK